MIVRLITRKPLCLRLVTGFAQVLAALPLLAQVASPVPPTPQLLWPRDGMEMTDVASFFRWAPIKG